MSLRDRPQLHSHLQLAKPPPVDERINKPRDPRKVAAGIGKVYVAGVAGFLAVVLIGLGVRQISHRAMPAGYCTELLDFCVADRFAQQGEAYHVKAVCQPERTAWKLCSVAVWNGQSYDFGLGGSTVKQACYVGEAMVDRHQVVTVRRMHLALIAACNVVQTNA